MKKMALRQNRPRCQICEAVVPWHRSLVINYNWVFCSRHARQYQARRHQGVSTQELDTRWSDTLDNWRERPKALDSECGTRGGPFNYLFFAQRVAPWVLFRRTYGHWAWQRSDSRGPDWVAINPETGDIRRFVSVWTEDVQEDLRGIRPAPFQGDLTPYWGHRLLPPEFRRRITQPYLDAHHGLQLSLLLAAASFPIYGLVGQPLGLAVCSVSSMHRGYRPSSVRFSFSSPHYPRVREAVRLASSDAHSSRRVVIPPEDIATRLFEYTGFSTAEHAQAGEPAIRRVAFSIAQVPFTGELYSWIQPSPLCWFHLTSEETWLEGSTVGSSEEEAFFLLEGLAALNEQADLVSQYQGELDQEHARLFRGER